MGQSYFIWKGMDCRNMGVRLKGSAPIVRPEERVEHIQIPGRSGDLTETEGADIYNSYIQTVTIEVHGGYRVRDIYKWLRGSGYVTFSGEPDRRQPARIIGAITLNRHSPNLDWWEGEVQFYCQPLKEKLQGETVTITSSGAAVINAGDVIAKPRITLTPTSTDAIVSAGGKTLTMALLTVGHDYRIDSDSMELLDIYQSPPQLVTRLTSGDFPVLNPGSNSVTGSGWSQLVIEKRERYL